VNLLSHGLGLVDLGLEGEDPAVTLSRGLEVQITSRQLQHELVGAALGDIDDIGKLDDAMGMFVGLILGVEPQTLSGLERVRTSRLGRFFLVEVSLKVRLGDGLLLEVKESRLLEESVDARALSVSH